MLNRLPNEQQHVVFTIFVPVKLKLDMVAPLITDPQPNKFTTLSEKRRRRNINRYKKIYIFNKILTSET